MASRYKGYPTNSAWQSARASALRDWLYNYLGGACDACGERTNLEIDHPWGRDWKPREVSIYKRHLIYRKEALEGRVRLLCRECNNRILPNREAAPTGAPQPF